MGTCSLRRAMEGSRLIHPVCFLAYTSQNWTATLNEALPASLRDRWWTVSDGITPDPITVAIQTEDAIARGIADPPIINEFSQHMYAYSSCRPASNARAIVPNIHNHTNITGMSPLPFVRVIFELAIISFCWIIAQKGCGSSGYQHRSCRW